MVGIEPTAYSLRVNCSTPEPHWQRILLKQIKIYRFIRNLSSEVQGIHGFCVRFFSPVRLYEEKNRSHYDRIQKKHAEETTIMKKSLTRTALILTIALLLSVFTGCGLIKKKDKTPWQENVEKDMPQTLTAENAGFFYLNGETYTFPLKVSDFLSKGWSFEDSMISNTLVPADAYYKDYFNLTDGEKHNIKLSAYNNGSSVDMINNCFVTSLKMDYFSGQFMSSGRMSILGTEFSTFDDFNSHTEEGLDIEILREDADTYSHRKISFSSADGYHCSTTFYLKRTDSGAIMLSQIEYECSYRIDVGDYVSATFEAVMKNDPSIIDALSHDNSGVKYLYSERRFLAEEFLNVCGLDYNVMTEDMYDELFTYFDTIFPHCAIKLTQVERTESAVTFNISYFAPEEFDEVARGIISELIESYEGDKESIASDSQIISQFLTRLNEQAGSFTYQIPKSFTFKYTGDADELDYQLNNAMLAMLGLYSYL